MYPFFCGYTRSVVDQAAKGDFSHLDAIMFGDHCVQLLSAADVIRLRLPDLQVGFYQLIPALKDNWSFENAERALRRLVEGLEEELEASIDEGSLRASIRLFNENRRLIRQLYDLRRRGAIAVTSAQMQHVVKSSMVMEASPPPIGADAWFEFRGADQLEVQEQSFALPNNEIMTLLVLPDAHARSADWAAQARLRGGDRSV